MATECEILAAALMVSSTRALGESIHPWIEELSLQTPNGESIHRALANLGRGPHD